MTNNKRKEKKYMLAEHVVELRHAASGSFLDIKGRIADHVKSKGFFPHWQIDSNLINFRDTGSGIEKNGAFVGYKSLGYVSYNVDTQNYFSDKAISFIKAMDNIPFYKIENISRLGVRTRVFIPSNLEFNKLRDMVVKAIYTDDVNKIITNTDRDIQFIFEFKESPFSIKIFGGPVAEKECQNYMHFNSDIFDKAGFFIDIDYFINEIMDIKKAPNLIKTAISSTWIKTEKMAHLVGV